MVKQNLQKTCFNGTLMCIPWLEQKFNHSSVSICESPYPSKHVLVVFYNVGVVCTNSCDLWTDGQKENNMFYF